MCLFALIMAALLRRSAAGTRGTLLKLRPAAAAAVRAYADGLQSAPSSVSQQTCAKGKAPPRVSPLELMYRLTCQGFYSRMHELQVGPAAWKWQMHVFVMSLYEEKKCMVVHDCLQLNEMAPLFLKKA